MTKTTDRLQNGLLLVLTAGVFAVGFKLFNRHREAEAIANGLPVEQSDWQKFTSGRHRSGPTTAPVTIVEFFDFQCPYCARFVYTLDSAQAAHPGELNVVLRHFPLAAHTSAHEAAEASECAAEQVDFVRAYRAFFSLPDSVTAKAWWPLARVAGVQDSAGFDACVKAHTFASAVTADSLAGEDLGIKGTPTILVNDQRFDGAPDYASLDSVIQRRLRASAK